MKHLSADLAIIGAGIVGLTLANLCAQQGLKVLVLEKNKENKEPRHFALSSEFDLRCFAISPGAKTLFESIGIWENLAKNRISPYDRMTVWDGMGFGEITFDANEISAPCLGYIIENNVLMNALWQATKENENITLIFNSTPTDLSFADEKARLTLEILDEKNDPETLSLTTELIIGAEGANSWIRNIIRIETTTDDYQQHALVANIRTELPHQKTAWQRFLPQGPLAFLPLTEPHTSSIVWTSTPTVTEENLNNSTEAFCDNLSQAFDHRLGKVALLSERKSFPLRMLHAKHYIKERIALVGDAAHVIHPLAGQGLNLGLQDAAALSSVIISAFKRNCNIGDYLVLRKYERQRRGQVSQMITAMKIFKELFCSRSSVFTVLRSLGLNATHSKIPFLKKRFMKAAMEY